MQFFSRNKCRKKCKLAKMSSRPRRELSFANTFDAEIEIEDESSVGGHSGDLDAALAASRQRAERKSTQVEVDHIGRQ